MTTTTAQLVAGNATYSYIPLNEIEGAEKLPYALRIVLENVLRNAPNIEAAKTSAERLIEAAAAGVAGEEIEFVPARVLFQDFTGVPVFVDFATMREACAHLGGDPQRINPQVPCNLIVDHSVIADEAGSAGALEANMDIEFVRNKERYDFLKWSQQSFENVEIVPPGQGICHQVNVEAISPVVMEQDGTVYFDTVVGTDSHTTTIGGIGVLGWGVGGIEAEAAALGQPIPMLVPPVVGVKLTGQLSEGVSAMDVALTFAEMLRAEGVVGCFVECFGEGVAALSATQRSCISNMTPEYGCTCTLFPIDERTIEYLKLTGRSAQQVALVEAYAKAQGLWASNTQRTYAKVLELDLSSVQRSLAGPSRPHERINFAGAKDSVANICTNRGLSGAQSAHVEIDGQTHELKDGAVAIAAITSCTTATDPAMMVAAGLLVRNAAQAGLKPAPWVKTIFGPGSHATSLLLQRAGLLEHLESLGFYVCGYGCMSCIGNSGPLSSAMHEAAGTIELASVLSGNRNFEGRISPDVAQNYLAAPAGVVAYALAGRMDFDFTQQPLGTNTSGENVFLADLWPTNEEIGALLQTVLDEGIYTQGLAGLAQGNAAWEALARQASSTFAWDETSTYVRRAPYFEGMPAQPAALAPIEGARVLAKLGDFITTDHISPAGSIAPDSAAAAYLRNAGVAEGDFNTYGSRRGNHEVMMRGTFANVKLQNELANGRKGGWTRNMETGEIELLFNTAEYYKQHGIPSVVLAGKMYGSGSSRDWAAKGPALLGVRAAFAESFERIHRSNLIGMGILPLEYLEGENAASLGLDGTEVFDIAMPAPEGPWPQQVNVRATRENGEVLEFSVRLRIDTPTEFEYYKNGGILEYVLRNLAS